MITMEQKNLKDQTKNKLIDFDENGNRIIYTNNNFLLQKWNNIIINYNGGTMDIFLNGDLVISQPNIIPYQNPNGVIIGSSPGIYGEMSNLVYYKTPVLAQNIKLMYESMKDMNPPVTV